MRPTLNDPEEYALIKKMYFEPDYLDEIEREEHEDRAEHRHTTNQAR